MARRKGQKTEAARQPDPTFRRESEQPDPDYAREHDLSSEANRWDEPGSSRQERGYPREGEREPTDAPRVPPEDDR